MTTASLPTLARAAADALRLLASDRRDAIRGVSSAIEMVRQDRIFVVRAAVDISKELLALGAVAAISGTRPPELPILPEWARIVAAGAEGPADDEAWAEALDRWAAELEGDAAEEE